LVTGGAGFIGSHLAEALLAEGHAVRVFDILDPQVHGKGQHIPAYLNPDVEFVLGDIRDRKALKTALTDIEVVFHEAAAVGVGQSMYEIQRYVDINSTGTANLLDIIANAKHGLKKLVVASSMSLYGEGKYFCEHCGSETPSSRKDDRLMSRKWQMSCARCDGDLTALPTDEEKPLKPTSVYAISKRDQEELCLTVGKAYGIPTTALRYFNVYGPRQALSNPYTGVLAIFCARLLNGKPPLIHEDGLQSRDYVHVRDIVQANLLVMTCDATNYEALNVGTGRSTSVRDLAGVLMKHLQMECDSEVTNRYRTGDIRHCYADITKISAMVNYTPSVSLDEGIADVVSCLRDELPRDGVDQATQELIERKLLC
jgi:dTDP-L-rhamnose 4-epimerase